MARSARELAEDGVDWRGLARAVGVSRVARVTGLDRSGVEVACAVRPGGHVLQVSNGKGDTFEEAARGAVLEAAELWASERVEPGELVFAPDGAGLRVGWRRAVRLTGSPAGAEVLVPASAVHCPPPGSFSPGPATARWTSNGMGAHPSRDAALLHALCEAVERDQLAGALPDGFTPAALRARRIDPRTLPAAAPRTARRAALLESRGFAVHLFALSAGLPLPVAGALLLDRQGGPVALTAGYGCALGRDAALLSALLEAAQSRLTDIHGAREDVAHRGDGDARAVERACARGRPGASAADLPELSAAGAAEGVRRAAALLAATGHPPAAVELAPPSLGVHVVKVIAPGLRLSELL
ncbi:MAG TPA: YcaO-like family protein [Anaeromyxobacteraceae bacterium]|jgi:ribosomal protein S12 methylthiotransferase accessory factor|nr:YcaO-like family protein [Anaeromyxobacteraceae bacterium]